MLKHQQKGSVSMSVIVVIVALVIIGGVVAYNSSNNAKDDATDTPQNNLVNNAGDQIDKEPTVENPPKDKVIEQKTYSNTRYKFSFNYPALGVTLHESASADIMEFSMRVEFANPASGQTKPSIGIHISKQGEFSPGVLSADQMKAKLEAEFKDDVQVVSMKKVRFGANDFVEVTMKTSADSQNVMKVYYFQKDAFRYSFRNNGVDADVFASVLNTFAAN